MSTPFPPRNGLLFSTLFHAALAATLMSLPILVRARTDVPTTEDLRSQAIFEPLLLPRLPSDAEGNPDIGEEPESEMKSKSAPGPSPKTESPSIQLKRDYAGARTIVSDSPDATKGVQTIRRPDLISPPKLAYPLRLPSLIMAPIVPDRPAPPAVKRNLEHPIVPNPPKRAAFRIIEPRLPNPALPVEALRVPLTFPARPLAPPPAQAPTQPSRSTAAPPTTTAVTKVGSDSPSSAPKPPMIRATLNAPKAAAVINAIVAPPDLAPAIPNAEMASRFIVAPATKPTPVESTPGSASGNPEGVAHTGAETPTRASVNGGTENKAEAVDAAGPAAVSLSSASSTSSTSSAPSAPGAAAPAVPAPATSVPGISISGGVPGRGGRPAPTRVNPRGSYALTIVSGGSSGGASRDLGVFLRSEIVYTVYIPMTGVGDGRDCPMQYALLSSGTADNRSIGLLTPPSVVKKVPATLPKDKIGPDTGPVFLTGIIDDNGDLQLVRAVRAMDARAQAALDALAQWLFLPAQLDGRPVSIKVLIGVSVSSAAEANKNQ